MGRPFLQLGPLITLVPSTAVGFVSVCLAETVVILIDLKRAELPACYSPIMLHRDFSKKGRLIDHFLNLALNCMSH